MLGFLDCCQGEAQLQLSFLWSLNVLLHAHQHPHQASGSGNEMLGLSDANTGEWGREQAGSRGEWLPGWELNFLPTLVVLLHRIFFLSVQSPGWEPVIVFPG